MRNTLAAFEHMPFFTIQSVKQLLDEVKNPDERAREILYDSVRAGRVVSLKRGLYMHRRFYEAHVHERDFLPAVSAILQPQSYVSLEYVLQEAQVLTQATYPVTAVTVKNTGVIHNLLGSFIYRHIKDELYVGFEPVSYYGITFFRASTAKALFDYLYFYPLPRSVQTQSLDLSEELRLNLEDFSAEQRTLFAQYVVSSHSPKMRFILENLLNHPWLP